MVSKSTFYNRISEKSHMSTFFSKIAGCRPLIWVSGVELNTSTLEMIISENYQIASTKKAP
jgi:hypothetical protein